jgi:hypothetical protein
MLPIISQLLPLILTLTTGLSVLIHEAQFSNVAVTALQIPFISEDSSDVALRSNEPHLHTERVVVSRSVQQLGLKSPIVQPREQDKKYVSSKRLSTNSMGDSNYSWPLT